MVADGSSLTDPRKYTARTWLEIVDVTPTLSPSLDRLEQGTGVGTKCEYLTFWSYLQLEKMRLIIVLMRDNAQGYDALRANGC